MGAHLGCDVGREEGAEQDLKPLPQEQEEQQVGGREREQDRTEPAEGEVLERAVDEEGALRVQDAVKRERAPALQPQHEDPGPPSLERDGERHPGRRDEALAQRDGGPGARDSSGTTLPHLVEVDAIDPLAGGVEHRPARGPRGEREAHPHGGPREAEVGVGRVAAREAVARENLVGGEGARLVDEDLAPRADRPGRQLAFCARRGSNTGGERREGRQHRGEPRSEHGESLPAAEALLAPRRRARRVSGSNSSGEAGGPSPIEARGSRTDP